jgi:riboflavin synthase
LSAVFTGITRGVFPVTRVERATDFVRYAVELPPELLKGLTRGASVAIDGACQTVVAIESRNVTFEAVRETLEKTTLDALSVGRRVSVERSFKVGDELGGHELAGHVTGTGEIARVEHGENVHDVCVRVPAAWMKYISEKGFIGVDGSSLTIGAVDRRANTFMLHLIPETLRLTNFGELDARTVTIVDTVERVVAERLAKERNA